MIKFHFLVFFHGCGEASGRRQIAGSEDCQCPDITVATQIRLWKEEEAVYSVLRRIIFVMLIIVEIHYAMISILLCYSRN